MTLRAYPALMSLRVKSDFLWICFHHVCVCLCACVCVHACLCVCVRVCVRARSRVCVYLYFPKWHPEVLFLVIVYLHLHL